MPGMSPAGTVVTNTPVQSTKVVRRAFALVTSLNFMWGLAYGLLDVLNKHFQEVMGVSQSQSGLLQAAFFGGYFTAAIPASFATRRIGYKGGILCGLALYAAGALIFIPASYVYSFPVFLGALYVLACGLAFLETSANPYALVLGAPEHAARRLNFAQAFNGAGTFLGPLIGGLLFFGEQALPGSEGDLTTVRFTYIAISAVVGMIALAIARTALPDIVDAQTDDGSADPVRLRDQTKFLGGVVSLFIALAGQVGVAAFFINYAVQQSPGMSSRTGSFLLSLGLLLFTIGRFTSPLVLRRLSPGTMLTVYATCTAGLIGVGCLGLGTLSIAAVILSFLFMSVMFPTTFALSLSGLGRHTKKGASVLVMAVCGAGILPVVMGRVADVYGPAHAFILPMLCYLAPVWYGRWGSAMRPRSQSPAVTAGGPRVAATH
jgi:FHS family L-fucose permease-like MFS transporter